MFDVELSATTGMEAPLENLGEDLSGGWSLAFPTCGVPFFWPSQIPRDHPDDRRCPWQVSFPLAYGQGCGRLHLGRREPDLVGPTKRPNAASARCLEATSAYAQDYAMVCFEVMTLFP